MHGLSDLKRAAFRPSAPLILIARGRAISIGTLRREHPWPLGWIRGVWPDSAAGPADVLVVHPRSLW
jgi:hypothetical protein